jgi:peptidoglycan hydrolase-like protein with peptidoglycan-binding domain
VATTGVLWASGTPVETDSTGSAPWFMPTNATGANNAADAIWGTSVTLATGTLLVEGYDAQTVIGAEPDSVDSLSVTVYGYVSNNSRMPTIAVQLADGGTLFGTPQAMTPSTSSSNSQTFVFTGVTWAQLADLGVHVSFTRNSFAAYTTGHVDAVSVDVSYTPTVAAVTVAPPVMGVTLTVPAPIVTGNPVLQPWTSGAHGEALLNLESEPGVVEVEYPAVEMPAAVVESSMLSWQSHETAEVDGDTSGMVSVPLGHPHVWVDGVDVTYFRDTPTKIAGWKQEAPFGWTGTTLTFPKVFHYEERGTGDLEWMLADAPVEIAIVTPEGDRIHRFTGHLTSEDPGVGRGRTVCVWHVEGALWQADHSIHPVPARLDPTDMGRLLPDELNGTPSRRFAPIPRVTTGIPFRERGNTNQTRWDYATDLLAKATVDGGDQWTLEPTGPRSFALVLKDTTTVHWTITAGAPGVDLDLTHDHHERIDAVYGRGIGPDGYAWRNVFFPDLLPYDPPAYPYADPDQNVLEGDTDADTLTGTGISDWQRRVLDLGYKSLPVDGVFGPEDTQAVLWIQRLRGIEVDGFMAGQTWAATWNVGAVGGNLRTVRLPLAVRPEVEQFLYGANGATVGTNPAYDPSIIRHEIDVDFGAGVTKAQGREMARRILERGLDPGIVGTVKLMTCPWEGSRWEIDAGDNVLLKGWRGEDVLARVTALDADPESLTVTLTIDSEFRDAMAVVQILERNRESKPDPARRPGNPNRRSRMDQDQVTPFEGESPAGRLPRLPLYEGLWTVWPVPVSEVGLIAKLRIVTSGPVSRFAVSLWGRPVTANQLASKCPNPLALSNPWAAAGDTWLDNMGFIEHWGEENEAAGYGQLGRESEGDPLTGVLYDDAGVPYVSLVSPWLWVGLFSPVSCFIQGRIYPEPTQ